MDANRSSLIDSAMTLAAVSAFLYCASSAYKGGYLGQLGLDENVLDGNFQQMLYRGFGIAFRPALLLLLVYVSYRFFYSHLVLPLLNDGLRKNWRQKRLFLKLRHFCFGKRKDSEIEKREKQHSISCFRFAAAFFVLIFSLMYFESKGKENANYDLKKLDDKTFLEHEMVTVSIKGHLYKLYYLMCGARNCAGIEPETREVHYFPQNGHSYVIRPTKTKQLNGHDKS